MPEPVRDLQSSQPTQHEKQYWRERGWPDPAFNPFPIQITHDMGPETYSYMMQSHVPINAQGHYYLTMSFDTEESLMFSGFFRCIMQHKDPERCNFVSEDLSGMTDHVAQYAHKLQRQIRYKMLKLVKQHAKHNEHPHVRCVECNEFDERPPEQSRWDIYRHLRETHGVPRSMADLFIDILYQKKIQSSHSDIEGIPAAAIESQKRLIVKYKTLLKQRIAEFHERLAPGDHSIPHMVKYQCMLYIFKRNLAKLDRNELTSKRSWEEVKTITQQTRTIFKLFILPNQHDVSVAPAMFPFENAVIRCIRCHSESREEIYGSLIQYWLHSLLHSHSFDALYVCAEQPQSRCHSSTKLRTQWLDGLTKYTEMLAELHPEQCHKLRDLSGCPRIQDHETPFSALDHAEKMTHATELCEAILSTHVDCRYRCALPQCRRHSAWYKSESDFRSHVEAEHPHLKHKNCYVYKYYFRLEDDKKSFKSRHITIGALLTKVEAQRFLLGQLMLLIARKQRVPKSCFSLDTAVAINHSLALTMVWGKRPLRHAPTLHMRESDDQQLQNITHQQLLDISHVLQRHIAHQMKTLEEKNM